MGELSTFWQFFRKPHHWKLSLHKFQAEAVQPVGQRAARLYPWPILRGAAAPSVPTLGRGPEPLRARLRHSLQVWQRLLQEPVGLQGLAELGRGARDQQRSVEGLGGAVRREQWALLRAVREVDGQDGKHLSLDGLKGRDQEALQED